MHFVKTYIMSLLQVYCRFTAGQKERYSAIIILGMLLHDQIAFYLTYEMTGDNPRALRPLSMPIVLSLWNKLTVNHDSALYQPSANAQPINTINL